MQKITPLQYATFLYEITSKKAEVKKMAENFLAILAKHNDLGKIDKIIKEFEIYEKKQRGIKDVEMMSAKSLEPKIKNQIAELIGGRLEIQENVSPDLIGGLTLIIEDTMIDSSFKSKIRELNKALS